MFYNSAIPSTACLEEEQWSWNFQVIVRRFLLKLRDLYPKFPFQTKPKCMRRNLNRLVAVLHVNLKWISVCNSL